MPAPSHIAWINLEPRNSLKIAIFSTRNTVVEIHGVVNNPSIIRLDLIADCRWRAVVGHHMI